MLRLCSKSYLLKTTPNGHISSAVQLRSKSEWFKNVSAKLFPWAKQGNKFNTKKYEKVKPVYPHSQCISIKKAVVDWKQKSIVTCNQLIDDVSGLFKKNEIKSDSVMVERKKLVELLELEEAVATLNNVCTTAEQLLLKTNADIENAYNKLNKLDNNLHLYKVGAEAVIADVNCAIFKAVEQADKTSQALETQLQQALMVAEDKMKSSAHSLAVHKSVEKAEQLVLEATIAKLNQQQAIQQHQQLAGKKENPKLANIEKMAGFVVDKKLANAVQAVAQLRQAISMAEPTGEETVLSQSACEATVTVKKLEQQIAQLVDPKYIM